MDDNKTKISLVKHLPTTTVSPSRLRMFQPTRSPIEMTIDITNDTKWGSSVVIGKLGQVHASFIEAVFKKAKKMRNLDDGGLHILVDPYRIRCAMNGGDPYSGDGTNVIKNDVMRAIITLTTPKFKITGHIFDEIVETIVVPNPLRVFQNENENRCLWRVKVSPTFLKLLDIDINLFYDPEPISRLRKGVSQAIARHVATHTYAPNGGWSIDELIEVVGAGGTSQTMKDRRRDLKSDKNGLLMLGLVIENGKLTRTNDVILSESSPNDSSLLQIK